MGTSREFAAELGRLMEERGLSVSDLARVLDLTPSSVSQWRSLKGGTLPTRARVRQLEAFFGVEPDALATLVRRDRDALSSTMKITKVRQVGKPRVKVTARRVDKPTHPTLFTLGESTLGEPMDRVGVDEIDPDQMVFALSTQMVANLAKIKALNEEVDSLNSRAGELLRHAEAIAANEPERREETYAMISRAAELLERGRELLAQAKELRQLADVQRRRAEWVVKTTRHVVDEDKKSDDVVLDIKVRHVAEARKKHLISRQQAELQRRWRKAERSMTNWFSGNDQPEVLPVLSLLGLLVSRVSTLEEEVASLRAERVPTPQD